jgi:ribonuclease-3
LGDRVLGLVIAELLLQHFPDEDEGALAKRLAALVRAETLVDVATEIGLGDHILARGGDGKIAGAPGCLADACEAVIAALYQDGGLAAAQEFIARHWMSRLKDTLQPPTDAKTLLQEWAQSQGYDLPIYTEVGRTGPDHAPVFTVSVQVGKFAPAEGAGATKRVAERRAAERFLEQMKTND